MDHLVSHPILWPISGEFTYIALTANCNLSYYQQGELKFSIAALIFV